MLSRYVVVDHYALPLGVEYPQIEKVECTICTWTLKPTGSTMTPPDHSCDSHSKRHQARGDE